MVVFKNKCCIVCDELFTPTSPKQKFCVTCRDLALKTSQAIRDSKRNRIKYNILHTKVCNICGSSFTTYDSKRKYCGSAFCESQRKKQNGFLVDIRRNIIRKNNRKLLKYRNQGAILKSIKEYLNNHNYKLLTVRKYKNTHESTLEVICPNGHLWATTFHNFKDNSNRCAICYNQNNYVSKPEQILRYFISENFPDINVVYNDRTVISPKELDIYFPDKNLAIEICGLYWHGEISSGKSKDYHYIKMINCFNKGIRLLTIFEDELYDYKDVVLSRVRQALGAPLRKVYARKCQVKEITSKEANNFYNLNHIQGKSTALIRYGLYYKDELMCVGSLGKLGRKHTSNVTTLELKRFCTLPNVSVVGGIGKIFKLMKQYALENNIKEIRSYCDMRYANIFKPVYEVLGFELLTYTKYTPHYFKNQKRYRNISLRKTSEERLLDKTEWELRKEQGYDRIWDCGHRTYIYKIN